MGKEGNEVLATLMAHRSIRKYLKREVADEKVKKIINAC